MRNAYLMALAIALMSGEAFAQCQNNGGQCGAPQQLQVAAPTVAAFPLAGTGAFSQATAGSAPVAAFPVAPVTPSVPLSLPVAPTVAAVPVAAVPVAACTSCKRGLRSRSRSRSRSVSVARS